MSDQNVASSTPPTWRLVDALGAALQRWPQILLSLLCGALLGWIFSLVIPGQNVASAGMYVGINPYRGPLEKARIQVSYFDFRNLDDYTNWQLRQVEGFVLRPEIIEETLRRTDTSLTLEDVSGRMAVAWLTAGEWHFEVLAETPLLAGALAETWRDVSLEALLQALDAAQDGLEIDLAIQALDEQITSVASDLARQAALSAALPALRTDLTALPAGDEVPATMHWHILGLASAGASFDPAWTRWLAAAPSSLESPASYLIWLEAGQAVLDVQTPVLQSELAAMQQQRQDLFDQYQEFSRQSASLSPNLTVESMGSPAQITGQQPLTGWLVLAGGLLGLILWMIWSLLVAMRKGL